MFVCDYNCCLNNLLSIFYYVTAASADIGLDVFGLLLREFFSGVVLLSSSMIVRGFAWFPSDAISTGEHNDEDTGVCCEWDCDGNSLAIEISDGFVWLCKLSALYISCNNRITEASPMVSLKNNSSIVDVRIILKSGMARSSLPNLVG